MNGIRLVVQGPEGIELISRDLLRELRRRLAEAGMAPEAIEVCVQVYDALILELEQYAASLPRKEPKP